MIKIAMYVSNHGFGHASRISALAEQFISLGVYCHIVSEKPKFLFKNLNPEYSSQHFRSVDVGVKHGKNLTVDLIQTKQSILRLMGDRDKIIAREVSFIRECDINFIIADVPFLVSEIAVYAKIPAYAVSNFEWWYIYSDLFKDDPEMRPVLNCIWGMYQAFTHSFVLPFSTKDSTQALSRCTEVGLLARKRYNYVNIRKQNNWAKETPILLVMFGGEGDMEISLENLCTAFQGIVITTNQNVLASNHFTVSFDSDFVNLIHNADVVICKPGYSTFAEVAQFGKRIIYCPRGAYPEEIALVNGINRYKNAKHIPSFMLSTSNWRQVLNSTLIRKSFKNWFKNENSKIAGTIVSAYLKDSNPYSKLISVYDLGSNSLNYCLFDLHNRKELHCAHLSTKLGRGLKTNHFSQARLRSVQEITSPLMNVDRHVTSTKYMIATGVNRSADNSEDLLSWYRKIYGIDVELISPEREYLYVYYASKQTADKLDNPSLAIDIGGASTEVVFHLGGGHYKADSIPLGLLELSDMRIPKASISAYTDRIKERVSNANVSHIIGIGLTYTYLAKVLFKNNTTDLDSYHNRKIEINNMKSTLANINKGDISEILPYLSEPDYLDILRTSLGISISLLDKLGMSEIIVCAKGISAGYALWRCSVRH